MYQRFQRVIGLLKRALRKDQRLTVEEFNRLLQLSEAIIDYGRMIHEYCGFTVTFVIVEIPELARRFRETPQAIEDALLLLTDMGRAEPIHLHGCWKLQLADTPSAREEGRRANRVRRGTKPRAARHPCGRRARSALTSARAVAPRAGPFGSPSE